MFRIQPIALAAALHGLASLAPSVSAAGCYPAWVAGGSYSDGDMVSRVKTTETVTTTLTDCTSGSDCVNGKRVTETTTTDSKTYNFSCNEAGWCSNAAYDPVGQYGGSAWGQEGGECSGTATAATVPVPATWGNGGCPKPYASGTDYAPMAVVSVVKTGYTMVYQCASEPSNLFCGMSGYEPGNSQYGSTVWTSLGSCTGTISPTTSPNYVALADEGGCPGAFDGGADYEQGDKISLDGLVYQCRPWPASAHCSQTGYEPGTSLGTGAQLVEHWREAWSVVGYCEGTIAPTTSPVFVSLADVGGCPDDWSVQTYEEGDRVHSMGLVYACKSWPHSGNCGQAGFEPNVNSATADAWKMAWTVVGHCSGSRGPTASPSYDPANSVGACPEEWSGGAHTKYEEGDLVAVTVSAVPLRQVAYRCKAWPFSGYCGQLSPLVFGGDQGWAFAGSCDGSIGPTISPNFQQLAFVPGCPAEWNPFTTDYEAGDTVAYTVSDEPARKIVYKCRDWPNTGYCNQGSGFEPTAQYGKMAWTLVGACVGSVAPTASPVVYAGTCRFRKCVEEDEACVPGSSGCSCNVNQSANCKKKVNVCRMVDVLTYNKATDYAYGDVVRVGTKRFKCKTWPNGLWCNNEAYSPKLDGSIWSNAWLVDGTCSDNSYAPTATPSVNALP